MATSNSVNFSMTRNEIISDALFQIRVLGEGESPSTGMLATASRQLNRLIKRLENNANHVWKKTECTLFIEKGQSEYILGDDSTDHATNSYSQTVLTSDESASATVLNISSNNGMSNSDYIGIDLDDGTRHWSTITTSTATTVTIAIGLASIASSGNNVYFYTTKIHKPLDVLNIRRHQVSSEIESSIREIQYEEYMNLPKKTETSSTPIQWTYRRNNLDGSLFVYQPPSTTDWLLKLTYTPPFEDFDLSSNTADFPQEWLDVLVLGLAVRLAHPYGKGGDQSFLTLKAEYKDALAEALAFDSESTYISLSPDNE